MMSKQFAFLSAIAASASGLKLTPTNWESATQDKAVFIKFFAPWCPACKALKPDWDKLMEAFEGDEDVLIAEVDCDAEESKQLCVTHEIEGLPTLKFGDPLDLDDYESDREFEELKEFVEDALKPRCSVEDIELCTDEEKALIEKYQKMSLEELEALVGVEEEKLEELEEKFTEEMETIEERLAEIEETEMEIVNEDENEKSHPPELEKKLIEEEKELNEKYEKLEEERYEAMAKIIKDSGLRLMWSVVQSREGAEVKDEL